MSDDVVSGLARGVVIGLLLVAPFWAVVVLIVT